MTTHKSQQELVCLAFPTWPRYFSPSWKLLSDDVVRCVCCDLRHLLVDLLFLPIFLEWCCFPLLLSGVAVLFPLCVVHSLICVLLLSLRHLVVPASFFFGAAFVSSSFFWAVLVSFQVLRVVSLLPSPFFFPGGAAFPVLLKGAGSTSFFVLALSPFLLRGAVLPPSPFAWFCATLSRWCCWSSPPIGWCAFLLFVWCYSGVTLLHARHVRAECDTTHCTHVAAVSFRSGAWMLWGAHHLHSLRS